MDIFPSPEQALQGRNIGKNSDPLPLFTNNHNMATHSFALLCWSQMTAPHVPAQVLTKAKILLICGVLQRKQNPYSDYKRKEVVTVYLLYLSKGSFLGKSYVSKRTSICL